MVSNKTFREYQYIGFWSKTKSRKTGDSGPWLIKSVWKKWTDGVMKILRDQQLRKILSNIDFVVPGPEDKKQQKERLGESIRIYKTEGDTSQAGTQANPVKSKSPHGELILDFLNDMIDETKQEDFDTNRRKLLKQYFGIVDKDQNLKVLERIQLKRKLKKIPIY
jgi:hypothetical protein